MPTIADKVKLLVDWAPVLSILSEISGATTPHDRVAGVLKLTRFLATRTATPIDDEIVAKIESCLLSPEGQALVDCVVKLCTAVAKAEIE